MKTILLQLDTDPLPSTFDRVVAVDAGVEEIFSYGGVTTDNVEALIHGAIFTRGPKDLKNTAVFIGGSDVEAGEELLKKVQKIFFGPMRVSAMMDSNGSNTTAAAAVLCASKHLDLNGTRALVAGGTGPVGIRAVELLARVGARVRVSSRKLDRAKSVCDSIDQTVPDAELEPVEAGSDDAVQGVTLIIAAGAFGVQLIGEKDLEAAKDLKVAIDLNAVPPLGIAGIEVTDAAQDRNGVVSYGAIGVGGLKMKIHKAALRSLFESNDRVLDTEAIYGIGADILNS